MKTRAGGTNERLADLLGMMTKDQEIKPAEEAKNNRSAFSQTKWQFFLDAPFEIASQCCNVMKKGPAHKYARETGRKCITGQMASESRLRTEQWIRNGCNGFNMKSPVSNPMSFWFDDDVLWYAKLNNVRLCSIYGDIVREDGEELDLSVYKDGGIFDLDRPLLTTTGCKRTGCMFCGYGCHLEKPGEGRFERMKVTHPKLYDYIMRPEITKEIVDPETGEMTTAIMQYGLNYKAVIDWINEHGHLDIRY